MNTVFVVHGVGGYPDENWFPWLKNELEKDGHRVVVPRFPTPEGQNLEKWMAVAEEYSELLNDAVVVGHSLGVPFLLSFLEKHKVKKAIFVAGFCTMEKEWQFYEGAQTFVEKNFEWEKIRQNCPEFVIFHSDNDPYVSLERAKILAKNLGITINVVKNAGHFNAAAGYEKFELLLEEF